VIQGILLSGSEITKRNLPPETIARGHKAQADLHEMQIVHKCAPRRLSFSGNFSFSKKLTIFSEVTFKVYSKTPLKAS